MTEPTQPQILEIMRLGKEIIDIYHVTIHSFELKPQIDFEVMYLGENVHLVVLQDDYVWKVGFYNFHRSKEPLVIFGEKTYFPLYDGFNLDYWVQMARIARGRYDRFCEKHSPGYAGWKANQSGAAPLTPPVKPTPPPVRVIKNEQVIAGRLSDK